MRPLMILPTADAPARSDQPCSGWMFSKTQLDEIINMATKQGYPRITYEN
jgi:hypothetical protein